jgi:hypothetical protein
MKRREEEEIQRRWNGCSQHQPCLALREALARALQRVGELLQVRLQRRDLLQHQRVGASIRTISAQRNHSLRDTCAGGGQMSIIWGSGAHHRGFRCPL